MNVHDGSCFDPIQVVCEAELTEDFATSVGPLGSGCSVDVTGTLVESKGKGQSVEILASSVTLVGGVDDPESA